MTRAITAATESPTALHSGRGSSPNRRSRLACSGDVILIQFRRETSNASYGICLKHTHTPSQPHEPIYTRLLHASLLPALRSATTSLWSTRCPAARSAWPGSPCRRVVTRSPSSGGGSTSWVPRTPWSSTTRRYDYRLSFHI